ncbi:MAG: fibronectin type III domain-containing protein [Brumimicrobium sp.]|nr:fibronectin type III domain-containing protein [Brumimicrobium sp.]
MKKFLLLLTILPLLVWGQGSMDFESVSIAPGTAYTSDTYTENGITYSYSVCRDTASFPITNKGLMLRRASDSYFEWTIPNGIGDLTFQYRKAFTGANVRQLEILVDGVQFETTNTYGGSSEQEDDIYTYTGTINKYGSVVIQIKNVGTATGNKQTVIDNISWTAPSCPAPTDLQVTVNPDNTITVTWTATTPAPQWGHGVAIVPAGTTPDMDNANSVLSGNTFTSGVLADGDYDIYVVSVCDYDIGTLTYDISDPISETNVSVPAALSCEEPTNLEVTVNPDNTLTVTWDAPTPAPANYGIIIAPAGTAVDPSMATIITGTSYTSAVLADDDYDVYVASFCDISDPLNPVVSNPISEYGVTVPGCFAPTNLVVTVNSDNTLTVTWDAAVPAPADDYAIVIVPTGTSVDPSMITQVNGTTYTSSPLADGNYDVYVGSLCDYSNPLNPVISEPAEELNIAVPLVTCPAPSNLVLVNNGDGSITVSWDAAVPAPAQGYGVAIVPNGTTPTIADFSGTTSNPYISDVLAEGDYDVYVVAVCNLGAMDISTPIMDGISVSLATCDVVTDLDVEDNFDGTFTVTWTEPMPAPFDGYDVEVYDVTNSNLIGFFHVTTNSYDSGVLPDGEYAITVYAVCDDNFGITSDGVDGGIVLANTCDDVTDLDVEDNGDGTFTVTWTEPTPAPTDGYEVEVYNATTSTSVGIFPVGTNSYTSGNLTDGNYEITVYSICDDANDIVSDGVDGSVTIATSGINVEKIATMNIYPNPANKHLTVKTGDNKGVIDILDVTGKVIYTTEINSNVTTINVDKLPMGVYFVKFQATIIKFIRN